jgi:plasmid maintenance system antidote protein VapI
MHLHKSKSKSKSKTKAPAKVHKGGSKARAKVKAKGKHKGSKGKPKAKAPTPPLPTLPPLTKHTYPWRVLMLALGRKDVPRIVDAAKAIGCVPSNLSRFVSGKGGLSLGKAIALAQFLDVGLERLIAEQQHGIGPVKVVG